MPLTIFALDSQRYAIWREGTRDLADLASERLELATAHESLSELFARLLDEEYESGLAPAIFGDELGLGIPEPVVLEAARANAMLARVSAATLAAAGADAATLTAYAQLVALFEKCAVKRWTPVSVLKL